VRRRHAADEAYRHPAGGHPEHHAQNIAPPRASRQADSDFVGADAGA